MQQSDDIIRDVRIRLVNLMIRSQDYSIRSGI